jgi:hypothetical protein
MDLSGGLADCAPHWGAPSIDTDNSGWAHIAYIQLGCGAAGASTGYAVRTAGTPVGFRNN